VTILVTGGLGFIGSNFINRFMKTHDENLINVDSQTYAGQIENSYDFNESPKYSFINCDIAIKDDLKNIFEKHRPDTVVNFAAETHVDRSILSPDDFIKTNITGTFNLLELFKEIHESTNYKSYERVKFIHISTDEVYGDLTLDESPFTEDSNYKPSSPYSASKAASDHLVNAYIKTYKLPAIISNCSNNYGPKQYPEKLIPVVINCCLNNSSIPVYGTGENIRDWIHVFDHCDAIINLIDSDIINETFNIGGNNEISNITIIKNICNIMNALFPDKKKNHLELITFVKDRLGHDFRYAIDNSKISRMTNWKPKIPFDKGLLDTVKWFIKDGKN
tara:strand:- start:5691 stop:6692 length:1002 start_codon:yes stop_codon:yes gene_type:complete